MDLVIVFISKTAACPICKMGQQNLSQAFPQTRKPHCTLVRLRCYTLSEWKEESKSQDPVALWWQ